MPAETNTDRIKKLEEHAATLIERVDNIRSEFRRVELLTSDSARLLQDVDKRLAIVSRDMERLEKRLDDLLSRRWELWKLVLAAFLGGVLTVGAGFVSRWLDRIFLTPMNSSGVARPIPGLRN